MKKIIIKPLSQERFEAFIAYSRKPEIYFFTEELEYWTDSEEKVVGLISLDKVDSDYSIVILGRDEICRFRAIWLKTNIKNIDSARETLFNELEIWANKNDEEYYQLDCTRVALDPFQKLPDLKEEDLNSSYKLLRDYEGFSPAKGIIEEIMPHYIDIDGNQFVRQFQKDGFDQRLWELYLFCFLNENLFERDTTYFRPDFCVNQFGDSIGIEALTLGKPADESAIPDINNIEDFKVYMRTKFSNALRKKLKKRYWDEPYMLNKPFILAIADFHFEAKFSPSEHKPPSLTLSKPALEEYLYGGTFEIVKDVEGNVSNRLIPFEGGSLGFFGLPDADNVSAVIFSNVGTIAKFNRMGKIAGFGSNNVKIIQIAEIFNPDPKADKSMPFASLVEQGKHTEYWDSGINIYHNPNAKYPLNINMFPYAVHNFLKDNRMVTDMDTSKIHYFQSFNFTTVFKQTTKA